MLKKRIIEVNDLKYHNESERILFKVSSKDDLIIARNFFTKKNNKFRGIQIKLSHLDKLSDDCFSDDLNYYSIIIDSIKNIDENILKIKGSKCFIELYVPYEFVEEVLIKPFKIHRLIVDFENEICDDFEDLFAEIMSKRLFPLVKGVPFCKVNEKNLIHMIEIYDISTETEKPDECNGCIFSKYCSFSKESNFGKVLRFTPKKILNKGEYEDILHFLEGGVDSEDSSIRF